MKSLEIGQQVDSLLLISIFYITLMKDLKELFNKKYMENICTQLIFVVDKFIMGLINE